MGWASEAETESAGEVTGERTLLPLRRLETLLESTRKLLMCYYYAQ